MRLTEIIRASSGFGVMKKLALLEQHQRGGRDSSHGFASAKAVSSSTRESRNNGDPNDVDEAASSAGSSDAVSEPAIDPPPPAAASSSRVSERSHGRERERDRDRDRDRDIVRRSTVMNPRAFPLRLYDVLSSPDNTYLQWTLEGDAFMIKNEEGGGISDMLRRRFKSTFRCFVPVCRYRTSVKRTVDSSIVRRRCVCRYRGPRDVQAGVGSAWLPKGSDGRSSHILSSSFPSWPTRFSGECSTSALKPASTHSSRAARLHYE